MTPEGPEKPAIHVSMGSDVDESFFKWISVGAEEEGIPCRLTPDDETGATALAYSAAGSSRLGVGVGVDSGQVAVHERHMPAVHPVLASPLDEDARQACRTAGSNAARLVIGVPLQLEAS